MNQHEIDQDEREHRQLLAKASERERRRRLKHIAQRRSEPPEQWVLYYMQAQQCSRPEAMDRAAEAARQILASGIPTNRHLTEASARALDAANTRAAIEDDPEAEHHWPFHHTTARRLYEGLRAMEGEAA